MNVQEINHLLTSISKWSGLFFKQPSIWATYALVGLASTQQFVGFWEVPKSLEGFLAIGERFLWFAFCCTEFSSVLNQKMNLDLSLSLYIISADSGLPALIMH